MKVAVTATGPDLKDNVDPRFGRCSYFLIVDTGSMEVQPLENPNLSLGGGAGIQSAQAMSENGVSAVLTGNCGPNAFRTLNAAGIDVITGVSGTVKGAVEQFKAGAFSSTGGPNVSSHFGMGRSAPSPSEPVSTPGTQGRGMGTGTGRGMGRGMGRGRGMGMNQGPVPPQSAGRERNIPASPQERRQEIEALREQAGAMEQQLESINSRIEEIESHSTAAGNSPSSAGKEQAPGGLKAMVLAEKCSACGVCRDVCPVGAITIQQVAMIDGEKCTGCGECVAECPLDAITLVKSQL